MASNPPSTSSSGRDAYNIRAMTPDDPRGRPDGRWSALPFITAATAGMAPKDSRAYGCRGSFHLIAAFDSTAPHFPHRQSGLTHEIILSTPTPLGECYERLHRLFRLATVSSDGRAPTLLRRGHLGKSGVLLDPRIPNASRRAINGRWRWRITTSTVAFNAAKHNHQTSTVQDPVDGFQSGLQSILYIFGSRFSLTQARNALTKSTWPRRITKFAMALSIVAKAHSSMSMTT
jgi:hypothetical protein